ncbi:AraC-type DNA-binding protein [Pseudomonas sp. NFACC02]|uniref:AraC family transcriptional regulator n=1 Tax=Pseudomonas sp. NFACC02 TaxID=1566250 RepID=UPI0008B6D2F3|nr:AraC family transcriptional regulator [Pseudomonas sp. NFACC02]SEQ41756.1 AraC-type DNA-binding protein [Pseudomonas sp. NFACC02]
MDNYSNGEAHLAHCARDWVVRAQPLPQMERIEAYFHGHGFEMHRHDTYAIGHTLSGVQSFHYEKEKVNNLPGQTMVLHPDEPHDGHAGTEDGFRYRMFYLEPAMIQQVLGGKPLPFIKGGVSSDPRLLKATQALLQDLQTPLDPLELDDAVFDIAMALQDAAGVRKGRQSVDYSSAERARELLMASLEQGVSLDQLEQASDTDRWRLSRDFRALFGTSPHRYLTLRRLDLVRHSIAQGVSLSDASVMAGFSDQSHMTRHFVKTFGYPPGRWLKMLGTRT